MPIPRLMTSPVLELKKIKARSLPHTVMSYMINQQTHAKIIDPRVADIKSTRLTMRARAYTVRSIVGLEGVETLIICPKIW